MDLKITDMVATESTENYGKVTSSLRSRADRRSALLLSGAGRTNEPDRATAIRTSRACCPPHCPVERETGQQKARQRRQADLEGGHAQRKGDRYPDRVLAIE